MTDLTKPWVIDGPFLKFIPFDWMYDLTFGQSGHFNKKNHVSFMPHAFS